jgi:hypothetical protein
MVKAETLGQGIRKSPRAWPETGFTWLAFMEPPAVLLDSLPSKPISIGLTCWRWQKTKAQTIQLTAQRLGVTLNLTERIHGLRREIEAQVSGQNTDRFIGEFVRNC